MVRRVLSMFVLVLSVPGTALAGEADYAVVHLEGGLALTAPQHDRFGVGGGGALTAFRAIGMHFAVGGRLRAWVLRDGPPPADSDLVDPGRGGLGSISLIARLGFPPKRNRAWGVGLFVDGGGGGAITGTLLRATVEGAIGYGIALGRFVFAPVVRYVQVLQPDGPRQLDGRDARLVMLAFELHDLRRPRARAPRSESAEERPVLRLDDRDADGVIDLEDECIEAPEDRDGFEDEDGCPDPGAHPAPTHGGSR
jgi:hypothetical protein